MRYIFGFLLAFIGLNAFAQTFTSVTKNPVTEVGGNAWASGWGDYDNDGDIDLYVSNYLNQNFLYRNNGNGTFTKMTGTPVTSTEGHWSSAWVDYDDDGDLDLYVVNSYTSNNELFRNNGSGTFTSVASAITNTAIENTNNSNWADVDSDGDLDMILFNGSNADEQTRNENNSFYRNNGNGTFTKDVTSIIATDGGLSEYGTFSDYDWDGDQDLFVVNTWDGNFFYENTGNGIFTKITTQPFLNTGEQPLSACWGDFNNDGNMDLVVGAYTNSRVYFNNGDNTFRTKQFPAINGNATGVSIGDFNLDGYLDVIFIRTAQAALYYLNNGDETFTMTNAGDLTLKTVGYTNSAAAGDYDNDGDLDVFVNNDDKKGLLFENTDLTANWLKIKLVGTTSNSQGIGARVMIRSNGKWQHREVAVMSGYRTQNSVYAHFGLGAGENPTVDLVRVEWPSGNVQLVKNVAGNQLLTLTEANSPNAAHTMNLLLSTDEDESLAFTTVQIKNAFTDNEGDRLKAIKIKTLAAHGELRINDIPVAINDLISVRDAKTIVFIPADDFFGNATFEYEAIDYRGLAVNIVQSITVTPVNDAPTIAPIANVIKTLSRDTETIGIAFTVNDIDNPLETLTLSATSDNDELLPESNLSFTGATTARTLNALLEHERPSGSSFVTVTVSDGILSATTNFTITVDVVTDINDQDVLTWTAYPNPTKETLYLKTSENSAQPLGYELFNSLGQKMGSGKTVRETDDAYLRVNGLPPGIYYLKVAGNDRKLRTVKFVKE